MRNNVILASLFTIASLAGCVGGFEEPPVDDPGGDSAGKTLFDSSVKSFAIAACAGCHQGEPSTSNAFFGDNPTATAYTALTNDRLLVGDFVVVQAKLLTKGAHAGPAFTADQAMKVTAWLTQEAIDRNVDQTQPVQPPANQASTTSTIAMQKFAGCMAVSVLDWETEKAYKIAQTNSAQGVCTACHTGGAGGFYADNANTYVKMFERNQEQLFFTGMFSTVAVPGTPTTYAVIANETKLCAKGKERATGTGTHPTYNCSNNGQITSLKAFVDKINAKVATGTCGTPGFRPPAI
ncbi:MAG: hypothetical protein KBG15_14800 [Kofleriaceae bacterium]|nr:hypothetical protein [Kofleriaceae bacterium]